MESNGVYDESRDVTRVEEVCVPNKFIDEDKYLLSTLSTDNFPSGIAKVPVTWNNHFKNITKKIELYAGFFGIKQYPDKSLEPLISWAICDEKGKNPHHNLAVNESPGLKHQPDYWSPHFADILTDSAIYDIKNFKTHSNSISYLRSVILDSLSNNASFKSTDYLNDTIQIQILSNGKAADVQLMKTGNAQLAHYLTRLIKGLPEPWFPALSHPTDILDLPDFPEETNKIKVRANSIVKIGL